MTLKERKNLKAGSRITPHPSEVWIVRKVKRNGHVIAWMPLVKDGKQFGVHEMEFTKGELRRLFEVEKSQPCDGGVR